MTSKGSVRLTVVLLALLATSSPLAAPLYPYPLTPPTPGPRHVIASDLDDDGRLDLVVTYAQPAELHVYLGNGDGSFEIAAAYPVGTTGHFAALGDFDGDGKTDLAMAADLGSEGVAVLMGHGDGTFGPLTQLADSHGALEVVVGDLDDDGIADLVAAGGNRDVFFGNGDGSFGPGLSLLSGTQHVAVADFNGDGFDDVASSQPATDEVRVYLSNGERDFSGMQVFPTGEHPGQLVAGDVDDDQLWDLVVGRTYGSNPVGPNDISVLRGRGDGTFEAPDACLAGHDPVFVAVADLDADGLADLVASNMGWNAPDPAQPAVSLFLGTGGGGFGEPIAVEQLRYGGYSIAVGDFDGDGNLDLAKPDFYHDDVGILFGNGDGTFVIPESAAVGQAPQAIALGDLDEDGRADLVTANMNSDDLSVLLADGAGSFAAEKRYAAGFMPVDLVIAELNGDDDLDLAVANSASDDVWLLPGKGDGSFSGAIILPVIATFDPSGLAVGRLDDDPYTDLAATGRQANRVALFAGNGDGTFDPPTFTSVGSGPSSVAAGDLDGDGTDDLAVTNFDADTVSVLLADGDGSFTAAATLDTHFGGPLSVAIDDLNGDGRRDLVVVTEFLCGGAEDCEKPAHVFLGRGDGSFDPSIDLPYFWGNDVTIVDVDGDGRLDLVGDAPASVWLGHGDGTFGPPQYHAGYGMSVAAGDLDLDGRIDLVVADEEVPILLNRSGPEALTFDADGVTLVWPAVTGALFYDLYRGELVDLVDGDEDGLPDAGYGLCLTGLDDDARDTFFEDAEIPSPAGSGFFYLMSVVTAAGEQGLGTTSAGQLRLPQSPCP